jgi:hypothetical protein
VSHHDVRTCNCLKCVNYRDFLQRLWDANMDRRQPKKPLSTGTVGGFLMSRGVDWGK